MCVQKLLKNCQYNNTVILDSHYRNFVIDCDNYSFDCDLDSYHMSSI